LLTLINDSCRSNLPARRDGEKSRRSTSSVKPLRINFVKRSLGFFAWLAFSLLSLSGVVNATSFDSSDRSAAMAAADKGTQPATPVNFQSVTKGYRSGIKEPLQSVIRSESEWQNLWRKHSNELYSTPPTVRFDQEVAVVIFLGEKPTGGYDVSIVRAERSGDELVIYYQEKAPAPGSGLLAQAFMQPYHIVRIFKRDLGAKVTFRRES
jgi:hypothetical protein